MRGYIDLHSHVLPGLDDGPQTVDDARELARALFQLGFSTLHPTPHQKSGSWTPTATERQAAQRALSDALAGDDGPELAPAGGENMWDELFLQRQTDRSYPTYAGDKAFLLELPPSSVPPQLEQRLFDFQLQHQRLPVLAHVERYLILTDDLDRVEALSQRAALLVNLATLGGLGGWRLRRRARKLVERGLIHAASTDAHSQRDVEPTAAGIRWIASNLGDNAVSELLISGPRAILAGALP
ncbi:MAG: hypothetical protein H6707_08380 [Deltaproteobacteria bacterium]|nr:hypothetical protein [Deltaproteobacteria bacterium]